MPVLFADWAAVLAAGEAWAAGADPWAIPNVYDLYGRPHVYGPGWLVLGNLGLGVSDTWWSGSLLMAIFVFAVARILDVHEWRSGLGLGLVLVSAPLLLALNRANNDLALFLIVGATAWAAGRGEPVVRWFAVLGLVVAALLKFYPAAALTAIIAMPGSWRERMVRIGVATFLTSALAVWQWEMIHRSLVVVPTERSWWMYDARAAFGALWGMLAGKGPAAMILGSCTAMVPALIITWFALGGWWRFLSEQGSRSFFVVAAAMCWVGCLLAGPSYVYRAIWLLPVFGLFLRDGEAPRGAGVATGFLIGSFLMITHLKQISFMRYDDEGRSDEATRVFFLLGAEQVLLLATLWVCCVMLAGWAWRCAAGVAVGRRKRRSVRPGSDLVGCE